MKKLKTILLVLAVVLLPITVNAKLFDSVNKGKITGEENGFRFNVGQTVEQEITNDGLTFLAGQDIKSKSTLSYGFYAGETIDINDTIEKDLFVAGQTITINGTLSRDVFVAGQTVKIGSSVGRNLYAAGELVDLRGITVNGNVKVGAEKLLIDDDTVITGKLSINDDIKVDGKLDKEKFNIKYYKSENYEITEPSFREKLSSKVTDMAMGFIVLVALLYVASKTREKMHEMEFDGADYIMTAFKGLVFVVVVPIILIVSCLFVFTFPLAMLALVAYVVIMCVASLVGQYYITRLLIVKFTNNDSILLAALSSVVGFGLIELIPYVGSIVSLLVFFFGVGLIYSLLRDNITFKETPNAKVIEEKVTKKTTKKKNTEE